jgi:hypothetical protein
MKKVLDYITIATVLIAVGYAVFGLGYGVYSELQEKKGVYKVSPYTELSTFRCAKNKALYTILHFKLERENLRKVADELCTLKPGIYFYTFYNKAHLFESLEGENTYIEIKR